MSDRRISFFIVMAALVAVALFSIAYTDISSADPDDPEGYPADHTDFGMPAAGGCASAPMTGEPGSPGTNGHQGSPVVISPGPQAHDQMDFIHQYEMVSAEKKALESAGMRVLIRDITPVPGNEEIYEAVKEVIGSDSFVELPEDEDSASASADAPETDASAVDDEFMLGLADALEGSMPDLSAMIRAVVEMRSSMSSMALLQELDTSCSSLSDRKSDAGDSEGDTEESEVVVVDDNEDAEEAAPMVPVPAVPYASCGLGCVFVAADYTAECIHGAADGPAL